MERTRTKAGMIHALEIAFALEETATYRGGTEVDKITDIVGISDPLQQHRTPTMPSSMEGMPPPYMQSDALSWCKQDPFALEQRIVRDLNYNAERINTEIQLITLNNAGKSSRSKTRGQEPALRRERMDIVIKAIQDVVKTIYDIYLKPDLTIEDKRRCITEGKLFDLGTELQSIIDKRIEELEELLSQATKSWFSRNTESEEIETELKHIETTRIQRDEQMNQMKKVNEGLHLTAQKLVTPQIQVI